ncbi:MAG: purine-nucleoside phosphorylase [Fusobacteria bacterium]|nr:purine-nucleoside phosphorylase [Fusobacteriota bacterium]
MNKIESTIKYIKSITENIPKIAIILGSGFDKVVESMKNKIEIQYGDIPNFPISTVKGHEGKLIFGTICDIEIVVMKGRIHYYEGYKMDEIVYPILVFKELGVEKIILTNSAGAINKGYSVGDFVIINDHINHFNNNPLIGMDLIGREDNFLDVSELYNREMIKIAKNKANELNINYHEGIYIGVTGPCYETKSEIDFFRIIGADMVGMSTVPEAIMAHYLKIQVLGISFISNMATGILDIKHNHLDVLENAEKSVNKLKIWIEEIIKAI